MYTIKDMLYGIAIGDAVGVPYEFEKIRDIFIREEKTLILQ